MTARSALLVVAATAVSAVTAIYAPSVRQADGFETGAPELQPVASQNGIITTTTTTSPELGIEAFKLDQPPCDRQDYAVFNDQICTLADYVYQCAPNDPADGSDCTNLYGEEAFKVKFCENDDDCEKAVSSGQFGQKLTVKAAANGTLNFEFDVTLSNKACITTGLEIIADSDPNTDYEIKSVIVKGGKNGYCNYTASGDPVTAPNGGDQWCTPLTNANGVRADISHISLCMVPKPPAATECPECASGPKICCEDATFNPTNGVYECNSDAQIWNRDIANDARTFTNGKCCVDKPMQECDDGSIWRDNMCVPVITDTAFAASQHLIAASNDQSQCFSGLRGVKRWGWVNTVDLTKLADGTTAEFYLYAGAAHCETKRGWTDADGKPQPAGKVTLSVDTTHVIFDFSSFQYARFAPQEDAHLHVIFSGDEAINANESMDLASIASVPGRYNKNEFCKANAEPNTGFKCTVPLTQGQFIHWIGHTVMQITSTLVLGQQ